MKQLVSHSIVHDFVILYNPLNGRREQFLCDGESCQFTYLRDERIRNGIHLSHQIVLTCVRYLFYCPHPRHLVSIQSPQRVYAVSYTHLDVYKRQELFCVQ